MFPPIQVSQPFLRSYCTKTTPKAIPNTLTNKLFDYYCQATMRGGCAIGSGWGGYTIYTQAMDKTPVGLLLTPIGGIAGGILGGLLGPFFPAIALGAVLYRQQSIKREAYELKT